MIRSLLTTAAFGAFALIQLASSAALAVDKDKLLKCVVAQNCSVIQGVCPGEFVAVNIRYENAESAKYAKERSSARCDKKVRPKNILNAQCIENQCTLKNWK